MNVVGMAMLLFASLCYAQEPGNFEPARDARRFRISSWVRVGLCWRNTQDRS